MIKKNFELGPVDSLTEVHQGPTCGIVMPLSAIDGCSAGHWADVQSIIKESVGSITEPIFTTRMVSDADEVGVIQKRIVQNIFLSDVIVCDVSCRNPNVMFELGMRLAFDRPAVIIKDDKTPYSFDTGVIEHLTYPRDLRYNSMLLFRKQLADKVLSTHQKNKQDPTHSTFLRNFGTFKVASLNTEEVKSDQLVITVLEQIQSQMARLSVKVERMGQALDAAPLRGGADPILSRARKLVRNEKESIGPESWNNVCKDEGFANYIANQLREEFPGKNNIEALVERAIRSERA
jgi:hypothetical protein